MGNKLTALPYKTIDNQSVSGTTVVTSSVTSVQYQDSCAIQCVFTGTPTGIFDVQGSLDYKPTLTQGVGTPNSGTWTSLVQGAPNTLPVTVASGTASVLVNVAQLAFSYIRCQFTSSTASGTITAYITNKSWSA